MTRGMARGAIVVLVAWIAAVALLSSREQNNSAAERKAQIAACIDHGGIPVPIAGVISSQGIGCAKPLGDE